jgi:hypothetical protein
MTCGSLPSRWGLYASGGSRRAIWPLLIVIALLGMGEARAQGGWSGAIADIAGPFSNPFALVGVSVDGAGNAIAVWQTSPPGIVNIRAARYTVASNTWDPGVDLAAENFTDYPGGMAVMANDDEGNVVVAWASQTRVRAVSYLAGTGAWTAPHDVATFPFAKGLTIAGNGPGHFVLAWVRGAQPASIESARFTPMTNTWTAPVTVSSGSSLLAPAVAVDLAGNATAVWCSQNSGEVTRAARQPAGGVWSAPVDIAAGCDDDKPLVNVDAAGDPIVVLEQWPVGVASPSVKVARYRAGNGKWSPFVTIGAGSNADLAVQRNGDAVLAWEAVGGVHTSRYTVANDAWSSGVLVSPGPRAQTDPQVAVDTGGNAMVVWTEYYAPRGAPIVLASHMPSGGAWGSPVGLSTRIGDVTVASGYADVAADLGGNFVAVWEQPFIGATPGSPVITGLAFLQSMRWLASGAGSTSPTGLAASVAGTTVTLTWQPPATAPDSYIVEAGASAGTANLAQLDTGSSTPALSVTAPPGTYYVRVRARTGSATSAPSNEVVVTVPSACQAPSPPGALASSVSGQRVMLTWLAAPAASSYVVEAGSAPGASNVFNGDVGGAPALVVDGVPDGQYFVRTRAVNSCGVSGPSNEVVLTVAGCEVPATPTGLAHTVTGSTVVLGWDTSPGATAYSVEVGSSAGSSDVFNGTAGPGTSLVATGVSAGRYFVRVRGVSVCGVSGPSSEIVIDVGSE